MLLCVFFLLVSMVEVSRREECSLSLAEKKSAAQGDVMCDGLIHGRVIQGAKSWTL